MFAADALEDNTRCPLPVDPASIPVELKKLPRWLAWELHERGGAKPAKRPLNVRTGRPADVTNPRHYSHFDDALGFYLDRHAAGVGFGLFATDPFTAADFDGCLDPATGDLEPLVSDALVQLDTYAEVSPSGRGVRAFGLRREHRHREPVAERHAPPEGDPARAVGEQPQRAVLDVGVARDANSRGLWHRQRDTNTTRNINMSRATKAKPKDAAIAARTTRRAKGKAPAKATTTVPSGLVRTAPTDIIEQMRLDSLIPARINDKVYKPVDLDDPATQSLARLIRDQGLLEPIVVTLDGVILSGHRRRVAARVAGLKVVPVRRHPIESTDPGFEKVLVSFNAQRVKTSAEAIREEVIRTSPEDAHNALLAHRRTESAKAFKRLEDSGLRILDAGRAAKRSVISPAKRDMLNAAAEVFEKYRDFWPLTLRQVHYRLLGKNVLRNTDKPPVYKDKKGVTRHNLYRNSQESYKDLSDILTRARLTGEIRWEAMHDPTRPRTDWTQWDGVGAYVREQMDEFLCGYKRNLLQSQPAYVELVVEKLTVHEIANRAAGPYHVPVGVGRGYTSATSLDETADRFRASGKDRFILLIAGDFDPEGEDVCRTWGACLRDEHGVRNITTVKVGVNPDQVHRYSLSPLPMKETSSRAAGFEEKHGKNVYELEAFEPDVLQTVIRDAIRGVLDLNLFADEQRRESEEAQLLMAIRAQFRETVIDLDWNAGPHPKDRSAPGGSCHPD